MGNIDLKDFIEETVLENTNNDFSLTGDMQFRTLDQVYIESFPYAEILPDFERYCHTTDYAVMNGAMLGESDFSDRNSCWQLLRSAVSYATIWAISPQGNFLQNFTTDATCAIRPATKLKLSAVLPAMEKDKDLFKISPVTDKDGKVLYHTIEFGKYPKSYVGDDLNQELEKMHTNWQNLQPTNLTPTGKEYTANYDDGNYFYNYEYQYRGQKYVRVICKTCDDDSKFSDGTPAPESGTPLWAKVEPITWKIRNWNNLPKIINPDGNGFASTIDIQTEECITTLPFYPTTDDDYGCLWQNSTIRGYLNGINVNNITSNGNVRYTAPKGGDFTHKNFLTEALNYEPTLISNKADEIVNEIRKNRNRKGYGIKVQETPMSVKDQIRFYIDNGKSFMLHGPSGIGKTRRIEEADPEFVSIVLRNGILPEEVIGKTIYPNNDKTQAGTWVPPAWYASLCEKCEQEPDKQHVLFIDEITNVKPSEQSLVFHLVLNNSIGPNIGPLPENAVVVAAGNSKEESDAAYNMPEPLFRRFDGHIELKPDIQLWLEWGSEPSLEDNSRPKVHPLVANFVGTYGSNVFYSPYDSEEPPEFAIDPRGWEQVSDIIYDNNGLIARELIENKVGRDIATSFIAFAKTPPLMLEDILENNYDHNDIPAQFDAKYALALSLRNANLEQIGQVREFIARELGAEILAMFDVAWVGDNNERAIYLAGLPKPEPQEDTTEAVDRRMLDSFSKFNDKQKEIFDSVDGSFEEMQTEDVGELQDGLGPVDLNMINVDGFMKKLKEVFSIIHDTDLTL